MTTRSWERVECPNCHGFGIIDKSYHDPAECPYCNGGGVIIRYTESGTYAQYLGGPLLGRDLKRNREKA